MTAIEKEGWNERDAESHFHSSLSLPCERSYNGLPISSLVVVSLKSGKSRPEETRMLEISRTDSCFPRLRSVVTMLNKPQIAQNGEKMSKEGVGVIALRSYIFSLNASFRVRQQELKLTLKKPLSPHHEPHEFFTSQ